MWPPAVTWGLADVRYPGSSSFGEPAITVPSARRKRGPALDRGGPGRPGERDVSVPRPRAQGPGRRVQGAVRGGSSQPEARPGRNPRVFAGRLDSSPQLQRWLCQGGFTSRRPSSGLFTPVSFPSRFPTDSCPSCIAGKKTARSRGRGVTYKVFRILRVCVRGSQFTAELPGGPNRTWILQARNQARNQASARSRPQDSASGRGPASGEPLPEGVCRPR